LGPYQKMILRRIISRVGSGAFRRALSYPSHQVVGLPALSPTMEAGTIAKWKVSEGSSYAAGDVICEVETDKATVDFEAQDDGIVAKILAQAGNEVVVGSPIMVIVEDEKDVGAFANFETDTSALSKVANETENETENVTVLDTTAQKNNNPFRFLPSARFLAQSKNIDVSSLEGSGKGGRITKGDILYALSAGRKFPQLQAKKNDESPIAADTETTTHPPNVTAETLNQSAQTNSTAVSPNNKKPFALIPPINFDANSILTTGAPYTDTPASTMRKVISKRLTESRQTVPHFYTSIKVELDNIAAFRKQLQALIGVKVSVNDIVIRAVALALQDVPRANSSWIDGTAKPNNSIDVSVAVATPSGLITPIVFDANKKGLATISTDIRALAKKARDGKLQPHEFQGGTVSVSNLGMFGVSEFSAVINPPQACILAVGSGVPGFKLDDTMPKQITTMTSRLSADRRVVDEPTAAAFLQAYAHYIANPNLLVL